MEGARVPGENLHKHEENIQAPHRKDLAGIWTQTFLLWGKHADHNNAVQLAAQYCIAGSLFSCISLLLKDVLQIFAYLTTSSASRHNNLF